MAPQLKILSPFYDVVRTTFSGTAGAFQILSNAPNRIRLLVGASGDSDIGWSNVEPSRIGETILFAPLNPDSFTAIGDFGLSWAEDYVLTGSEIWLFSNGTILEGVALEVIYHPERAGPNRRVV